MKNQANYHVRNPHGTVIVVGESEIEGIKRKIREGEDFEVLEKIDPSAETAGPQLPTAEKNLECPICGTKGVGRNRFKTDDDVKRHVGKKHPDAG